MTPLELVAHDIICICKYGSPGGSVSTTELRRVTEYLTRLGKLPEQPAPAPRVRLAPPAVTVVTPPKIALPTIKLPGSP